MREKIVEFLLDRLSYAYCDNCKGWDDGIDSDKFCDCCNRKSQNWALGERTAEKLAQEIVQIFEQHKED